MKPPVAELSLLWLRLLTRLEARVVHGMYETNLLPPSQVRAVALRKSHGGISRAPSCWLTVGQRSAFQDLGPCEEEVPSA